MGKIKVGKGFLIAQIVIAALGVLTVLLTLGVFGQVESLIKDIIIEAGGNVEGISNPFTYLLQNMGALESVEVMEAEDLEALDLISLKVIYAAFLFVKEFLIVGLVIIAIGLVLVIVALVLTNKATCKKELIGPMILSFVSVLFVGILSLVPGILFAITSDKDYQIVQ